jgi:DNA-binding NtrC family response regulator
MTPFRIFIIEDDPWYGELLKYHLSLNPDYEVSLFNSAKAGLGQLHLLPNVVCIDFSLPDMQGDQLLTYIKAIDINLPVIVISGQEDIAVAVNLLKAGANDYIVKTDNTRELLWTAIQRIRETTVLRQEVAALKSQLAQKFSFESSIIGQSEPIRRIFSLIEKAVSTNINVLIRGETGTGKEVVAQAIHYNSDRRQKPFVAVNMAAIPGELLESELFGHEKGAFTGANSRKTGKLEEAQGGTLFLDEIAELDIVMQSKILRAIQEREITRVGGNEKIKLNFRLITATHQNLPEAIERGAFREDLYYRIIGLPIDLPPLRERGTDILLLAKHFAEAFSRDNNKPAPRFASGAQEKLMKYRYPGNVRELKAVIELACVMADGPEITADDISFIATRAETTYTSEEKTLREYELDIIRYFLKKYDNNIMLVAQKLGIGKSTLYKMIQEKEIVL